MDIADYLPDFLTLCIQTLVDLSYPVLCCNCTRVTSKRRIPICLHCRTEMVSADADDLGRLLSSVDSVATEFSIALWYYDTDSPVRALHHNLKYGGNERLGIRVGHVLGRGILRTVDSRALPNAVVPIPLHRVRYLERGYNQAEAIARGVARILNVPVLASGLSRTTLNPSQTGLGPQQRMLNTMQAFAPGPDLEAACERTASSHPVGNRRSPHADHLLLVDDVATTGATLSAALRVLSRATKKKLSVAVPAMVRPVRVNASAYSVAVPV